MDVDCLTFTGSTNTGRRTMTAASQSNLKRVGLELGGKSPNIVFSDTANPEFAADVAVGFMFDNQGQVCEAPTRLLVQEDFLQEFQGLLLDRVRRLTIGNPLQLETNLGLIINEQQYRNILGHIEGALGDGVELAIDGRGATGPEGGYYLGPSVAVDVDPSSNLAQQEVFGPVLCVIPFKTEKEAIANGTVYGLGANVWSSNIDTVGRVTKRLVAGNINVNDGAGPAVELPFGGFKQSGFGRDRSLHALEKYSDLKNIIVRTAD